MRRYVLPFAVAVAAALAACSGGGSVLSTGGSSASNLIITSGNENANSVGQPLTVRVSQASGLNQPLLLHVQGVNGQQNGAVYPTYTWGVAGAVTGTYSGGVTNAPVTCSSLQIIPTVPPAPASPAPVATTFPYSLPSSSIQVSAQDSSYATFQPPALPPAPAGFAYTSPNQSYCARVVVTGGGGTGSTIVVVTAP